MNATIEVPRALVERARKHFERTGRPYLLRPWRTSDWPLTALPGDSGRWLVMLAPEGPFARAVSAAAVVCGRGDDVILRRLAEGAVTALAEVPRRFICDGRVVGLWEIVEGSVCVRGPVALSCLSWALRQWGVGFFVRLQDERTH